MTTVNGDQHETKRKARIVTDTAQLEDDGRIFAEPSAYADPEAWHAAAARLRRHDPISRVSLAGYPDFWAITRHADVMEIERNAEVFTNQPTPTLNRLEAMAANAQAPMKMLVQMDGDEHKVTRNIVHDWFKPGNVKAMTQRIDELSRRYVDTMAELGGACDFARDVAVHFPLQVILSSLGLPESDYELILKLAGELAAAEDPDLRRESEQLGTIESILEMIDYFTRVSDDRRANPNGDLASVIANAQLPSGGPLPDLQTFGLYLIIATAGHETTSNALAGSLLALIENPDQLTLLQERPELIDAAVDEFLRFVSPVKHFIRTCQARYTVRDVTFEPGDITLLSYASANRDEEVFPDPFVLDVTRANAASHLAFGFGHHFCLGAHLARMEMRSFLRELLGRLEDIELDGTPTFVESLIVSGPKSFPIRYRLR